MGFSHGQFSLILVFWNHRNFSGIFPIIKFMKIILPLLATLLVAAAPAFAQVSQMAQDPDTLTPLPSPPLVTQPSAKNFGSSRAAGCLVDTTGSDNYTTADFYGVSNTGTEPISTVTIDISAWSGAFFDFDGGATYGGAVDPVIGATGGMAAGDVTWTYDAAYDHPLTITANIVPPMAPGAFFRFGADTDFFVSDPCPGGNFATGGALVTVGFAGGSVSSDTFTYISSVAAEVLIGATFTLSTTGAPGGTMTFEVSGATPGGPVAYIYAFGLGSHSEFNPFTGTLVTTGLSSTGFKVAAVVGADAAGHYVYTAVVPGAAAGLVHVQAVDATTDTVSNVVSL